ncbi:class I SAM-dependent DNA methyltransferase [Planctomycetota bacterium]
MNLPQQTDFPTSSVTPWVRKVYSDAGEFWRESKGLHHAYIIYRTLRGEYDDIFKPDAVFYVGRSPGAYLKKVEEISEAEVRQWQRFLWNQAVVPMLIIQSRTQIRVYTAYTRPEKQDSSKGIEWILETTSEALELERLWTKIEAGTIYEERPELFRRTYAVDQFLLDNLNAEAHQLAATQKGGVKKNLEFAHLFLIRLLFVCYLIERGMIKGEHFEDEGLKKLGAVRNGTEKYFLRHLFDDLKTYSKKKGALCRIFSRVKDRFNGSLFTEGITKEKERYDKNFIEVLEIFLHGHEIPTGQLTLGFWAYDFRVIPIETISAVYESFLGAQGKIKEAQVGADSKRTTGAYYTPLHLAELTVDMALEDIDKPIHELKCLDPACGSGVFLVSLFGRMVDRIRREENYLGGNRRIDWARKLLPLLNQLNGLDINLTACHITCFSLYLALLEQLEPMDVEYLHDHGERLPYLLAGTKDKNTENKVYDTIHHGNLFGSKLSLMERDFDIVIGNPPWVSRDNQKDQEFLKWIEEDPNVLGPDKQIAHGFMWKAPEYLSDSGIGCLLLPTAVLLNEHTNKFQEKWLRSFTVDRVVNFSDLRFVLFAGAVHPCAAIRFSNTKPTNDLNIQYETPKTDIRSQKGGSVYIREEDAISLAIKDILYAATKGGAPVIWKSRYWGSWRDQRLLTRLNDLPKLNDLAEEPEKEKRWIKGQGCQPYTETDKERKRKIYLPWWDEDYEFLSIENLMNPVVNQEDFIEIPAKFQKLRRSPNKKIFSFPKVIVNHDSSKVAFCAPPVIFRHTLQAIAGPKEDIDFLRFLTIVIKSDIIQYYLFHTSSNWGTERDSVLFYELLSLPFFLPEKAPDPLKAQEIVEKVANEIKCFEKSLDEGKWFGEEERRKEEAKRIRGELEFLVRDYYDIDEYEAMLIEDTLQLAIKSFHPREGTTNIPTLRTVNKEETQNYTKKLCEMLNHFGRGSNFKVNGKVIKGRPYSVVKITLTDKIRRKVTVSEAKEELTRIFEKMESLLERPQGRFVFCQNLKVFDDDDLYILKPMQMRFWSRTAALNDADEIAGALLDSRGS